MSKVFPDASFGPEAACVDDDAYDAELAALPELCEFSFGVWHRHSPSRRELYRVLKSKKFDALILFFIFFNTLCMAMTDYRKGCMGRNSRAADFGAPDQSRCGQNRFVTFMNSPVFFVVFLAEVVLKLGALGAYFEGANTFFRDAWNILDFVCVSAAVLDELEVKAVGKLSTLRLFRILRPLKSLSKLKGLKKIVVTLLEALPNLREVVILLAVLLLVFAIALMQFYSGNLHYRCRITAHPTSVPALWYRTAPCFRGQNVSALAECFHGRYFPTAPEFEDYRYAMLLREEAAAETFGSQGSPSIQEMALRWNWGSEMGKHIAWTCSSPDFPASSYPGGIPTTDTYPRKYSGRFDDGEALTSDGKRWKRPRRCLWLVDEADVRICSRNGLTGAHKCFGDVRQQRRLYATAEGYANARDPSNCSFDAVGPRRVQRGELGLGPTHCGSNYDEFGSRRFKFAPILYERPRAARSVPGAMKRWQRFSPGFYKTAFPEFIPDLNFGYSNFDHVGVAWTTLFQAVTMEGWTDIMYMCMDSDLPVVAITLFVLLFMIGSMLVLNLVLGVITDTISDEAAASELEQADELDAASAAFPLPLRQNAQVAHGSTVEVAHGSTVEAAHGSTAQDVPDFKFIEARPKTPVLMPSHRPFFLPRRLERPASAALPGLGARAWLGALVTNFWFSAFIYACIFLNTAALCADEYPVTLQFATIMDFVNVVLALIFVAEMVIKLLAFGFEAYWSDAFNRFDGFIVVVSVASMGLAAASINFGSAAVSAMRCFRVFRIFKLAKNWPSLQLLLLTMYKTAQDIVNFAVLLFLFVLIFALWGMQAFANNLNFDPETHGKIKFSTRFGDDGGGGGAFSKSHAARRGRKKSYYLSANTGYSRRKLAPEFKAATPPPLNFDDFGAAMVTVFGILTGESWNLVMYDLMRGRGFEYGFIFMFATQLILVFCIMNLFLAILLANFSNNDELVPSQSPSFRDSMRGIARGFSALSLKSLHKMQDEQCELQKSKKHLSKRAWVSIRDGSLGEGPVGDELPKTARAPRLSRGSNKNDVGPFYDRGRRDEKKDGQPTCSNGPTLKPPDGTLSRDSKPAPRDDGDGIESDSDSAPTFQTRGRVGNRGWVSQKPKWPRWPNCAEDRSLCLFSKTHALRRVCLKVAESAHFDTCIVATILLSSFMLSIGGPLWDQKAVLMRTFVYLDDVFNAIFFTECGIKVVATGFAFNGPASYLRNSWNLLDFMIVAASAASYASLDGLTALKALRVVRVIRPLRMLSRSPGLKVVLSSLIQGIQGAVNVTMVCILFFFIFAIMGVGFFKGTMDACDTVNFPLASISLQRFIDDPVHLRKAVKSGLYDELMRSTKNQSTCFLDFDAAFINRKDYFNPKTNVASDFAVHKEDMLRRALPLLSSHFTTRRKKGPTGAKSGQRVQSAVQGLSPETSKFFAERPHYGGAALRDSKAWLSNHGNIDYYVPTSKDMCACLLNAESAWRNPLYMNFDTVPNAFSLLFEIYSTEGWLDYMFWNADACTGVDRIIARRAQRLVARPHRPRLKGWSPGPQEPSRAACLDPHRLGQRRGDAAHPGPRLPHQEAERTSVLCFWVPHCFSTVGRILRDAALRGRHHRAVFKAARGAAPLRPLKHAPHGVAVALGEDADVHRDESAASQDSDTKGRRLFQSRGRFGDQRQVRRRHHALHPRKRRGHGVDALWPISGLIDGSDRIKHRLCGHLHLRGHTQGRRRGVCRLLVRPLEQVRSRHRARDDGRAADDVRL